MAGMLLPALNSVREKGRAISCKNNLKQIQFIQLNYAAAYDDVYPPTYQNLSAVVFPSKWHWRIYSEIYAYKNSYFPGGKKKTLQYMVCPSVQKNVGTENDAEKYTTYLQNNQCNRFQKDGQSTVPLHKLCRARQPTIMITHGDGKNSPEIDTYSIFYGDNKNFINGTNFSTVNHQRIHSGSANVAFLDGHVGSVNYTNWSVLQRAQGYAFKKSQSDSTTTLWP